MCSKPAALVCSEGAGCSISIYAVDESISHCYSCIRSVPIASVAGQQHARPGGLLFQEIRASPAGCNLASFRSSAPSCPVLRSFRRCKCWPPSHAPEAGAGIRAFGSAGDPSSSLAGKALSRSTCFQTRLCRQDSGPRAKETQPVPVKELILAAALLIVGIVFLTLSLLHTHGHISGADGAVSEAESSATEGSLYRSFSSNIR